MTVSLSDLMKELQAGEEARARVPQLEASNKQIYLDFDASQQHAQELELAIRGYRDTIDSLNAKVRSLEVERDDAGFRELEAQDKLNTLLSAMRSCEQSLGEAADGVHPEGSLVGAIVTRRLAEAGASTPVQPTPVPMTEEPGVVPVSSGQSEGGPIAPSMDGPSSGVQSLGANEPNAAPPSSGQSDPFPSAPSTAPTQPSASGVDAAQSQPVPSPKTEEYRPFEGQSSGVGAGPTMQTEDWAVDKRWYNKPRDMSTVDWVASGGQP